MMNLQEIRTIQKINNIFLFLIIFSFIACDFTSGLNRDILHAQKFVNNQEYIKATEIYKRVLKNNPSKIIKTKINFQLAEINYLYLNKPLVALKYYEFIVKNIDDPLWQVKSLEKIADINFNFVKNYNKAIKSFETLIKFRPKLKNSDYYFFRLGESYFQIKDFLRAREVFKEILQRPSHRHYIDAFNQIALIEFYNENWEKAIEYWMEYLKREKNKDQIVKVKFLIANAYESNERLKEAYNIYYSLLSSYPNPEVLKERLRSLYERRVARKR